MNRLRTAVLLLAVTLAMLAHADRIGFSKAHPLVIGLDMDYAPLEYVDDDGRPQGFDVEFTQELMRRMDIPYTYAPNTWGKISGDVINGRVDLGMMVYSPYRKDIVNYSRAVFRLYYQIVYRQDNEERFDVRNLGGKSIAYMSSRPVTDTLTKAGAVLNVVEDLHQAVKDLSAGRYDAVICFRYQAKYIISENSLKNLRTEDLTLTPREYCYVSVNKQLIDAINPFLEEMEKDGTIEDIYGRDVTSQFGDGSIPEWVWYLIGILVIVALTALVLLQRRHARLLRREMERAQRSERLKTVFLGNVSHALRTPLNAIIGFSDVLEGADDGTFSPEERRELLQLINRNGHQLLYFINELLQLSNLESSRLELNRVKTRVGELLSTYCNELEGKLADGVSVSLSGDESLELMLDPSVMRQVTLRILENAYAHTREGSISIAYEYTDGGLRVEVADTGEGLPENLKDNIFALLGDENTYIQSETPGLGLTICKAIIDKLGGKIGARSEAGRGATFWYWVPERRTDDERQI